MYSYSPNSRSIKKRMGLKHDCGKTKATTRMQTENAGKSKEKRQFQENFGFKKTPHISDFDILSIYTDITKLGAIEEHLNLLYRPFTCFVKTECNYKLHDLQCLLSNTRYNPNRHPALFIRHTNPACSLKVYYNGNICCQGYSYDGAALGAKCFMNTMEQLGYSPVFRHPTFNVVNATFCMPFCVNLDNFCEEYHRNCLYNPETHPYLTYKIQNSIVKLAIFPIGYVFVLLSPHPRITQKAIAHILPLLYRHRATDLMTNERDLCSGDINFKLLWENEFQKAYHNTLKFPMPRTEENQQNSMLKL